MRKKNTTSIFLLPSGVITTLNEHVAVLFSPSVAVYVII